jgi:hypothetical protein
MRTRNLCQEIRAGLAGHGSLIIGRAIAADCGGRKLLEMPRLRTTFSSRHCCHCRARH